MTDEEFCQNIRERVRKTLFINDIYITDLQSVVDPILKLDLHLQISILQIITLGLAEVMITDISIKEDYIKKARGLGTICFYSSHLDKIEHIRYKEFHREIAIELADEYCQKILELNIEYNKDTKQ